VSTDLVDIFLLSLLAMFNPTLLAAATIMMLMPNPKRLMLGYLLGAYTTSIACGCVIVFVLGGSSSETNSAKHTISPAEDLIVGLLCLALAWVLRTGRDEPLQTRRRTKKEAKLAAKRDAGKPTESLPLRMLGKGDPKVTFLVGAVLSLPGASFLAAMEHIHKLKAGTAASVLLILYFCMMQQIILELPLIGYVFAPDKTKDRVDRLKNWVGRRGRTAAVIALAVIGLWLVISGFVALA
jgi:Sap, sulfolipid-1-addressing protein